ncbi:DUF2971 domain-containing protein [Klebsiella sp. CN_Kp091]|uniref:DUF2971 domain-containing protein n=1 Tax=unclassified Klebsiella TaxID=2608929 RepID=UPI0032B3B2A8
MYYFKYFRNDTNFDKSIRYNELFFAANSSLNDPMDLWFNPIFWDDVKLWEKFIDSYTFGFIKLLDYMEKPLTGEFYTSINELFKCKGLIQVLEESQLYHSSIIEIIRENKLAYGDNVTFAASFLMEIFVNVKNVTNFISVSFSKDPFNYLMWSHYANGFKGCVLIYEFENNKIKLNTHLLGGDEYEVTMTDVIYSNSPQQIDLWNLIYKNIIDNVGCFFTKNKYWEYEKESRLVFQSSHLSYGEIFHHHPSLVKGVIFGSRCEKYFKDKTIQTLKENRRICGIDSFLMFDTILNAQNEIELKSGVNYFMKNNSSQLLDNDAVKKWSDTLRLKVE